MKIRITGREIEKFQTKGLFTGNFYNPPPIASTIGKYNSLNQWVNQYETPQIAKDFISQQRAKGYGVLGVGAEQPKSNVESAKKNTLSGVEKASLMTAGLSGIANIFENNDYTSRLNKFRVNQGMTDAAYQPMRNVYSRGRNEQGYAWDKLTPIQFAGAPTFEYYGGANLGSFQEGGDINITKDVLGLSNLYPVAGSNYSNEVYDSYLPKSVSPSQQYSSAPVEKSSTPDVSFKPSSDIEVMGAENMDVDAVLKTLASAEGGKTGQQTSLVGEGGKKASATGRWQITTGTRGSIYNAFYRDQMSRQKFEDLYLTDPKFEESVARKHVESLLPVYGSLIFGAWYYPAYADKFLQGDASVVDKIPRKDYGNKTTWGEYVKNAQNKYFKIAGKKTPTTYKDGGEYELTTEEIDYILANGGQIEYL
jgi:hypothetical protein